MQELSLDLWHYMIASATADTALKWRRVSKTFRDDIDQKRIPTDLAGCVFAGADRKARLISWLRRHQLNTLLVSSGLKWKSVKCIDNDPVMLLALFAWLTSTAKANARGPVHRSKNLVAFLTAANEAAAHRSANAATYGDNYASWRIYRPNVDHCESVYHYAEAFGRRADNHPSCIVQALAIRRFFQGLKEAEEMALVEIKRGLINRTRKWQIQIRFVEVEGLTRVYFS